MEQDLIIATDEAYRLLHEAVMFGFIRLSNGEVLEMGTKRASGVIDVCKELIRRRKTHQKRLKTLEDFLEDSR